MIQKQKNIAIAEMLGYSNAIKDKDFYFVTKNNYNKESVFPKLLELNFEKRFYLDANWQFEAIDWIEKQNVYIRIEKPIGKLSSWFVNFDSEHGEIKEVQIFNKNRQNAIFEALYQFSQYIKDKRPTVGDPATYAYTQVKAEIDNFGKSKK